MSNEQAILAQLDATAERGIRPERAKAALADVPALPDTLLALEEQLTRATHDAEEKLQGAARHLVASGGKRIRPMVTLLACGASAAWLAGCADTISSARVRSQSPERTETAFPQMTREAGWPRRMGPSSMTSSCRSVAEWVSSAATAYGTAVRISPPHAPQARRVTIGRIRFPPEDTRWRAAPWSFSSAS